MTLVFSSIKNHLLETIFFFVCAIFSSWLMFSTFSYYHGQMFIASKAWSDFANHIPLIRSFSFGTNFPPQDPLFSGYPIRYHFLFYLFVGMLEKLGIRIDWALNIPSILGFFACLLMLYYFAARLFQSKAVGMLSVLFFLFNGTLSFLYFLTNHPLSFHTPQEIITNTKFPSFGPYDNGIVSAFWNLNIYTNQRHLAAAFALSLFLAGIMLFYTFEKRKPEVWVSLFIGAILGLSFFFHLAVFLMTIIVMGCLFLLFSELRWSTILVIIVAGVIALPQYLYMKSGGSGPPILFAPGYLIHGHLSPLTFFNYWFYNFGLHLFLMPIGFFMAPKQLKKIFLAFFMVFIIGNLYQFGTEMAVNHKFFNYFMLVGIMFSAYALVNVWKKSKYSRPIIITMIFFLTLSGIIDFFPIYNDNKLTLADYPVNAEAAWIKTNTRSNATIFNTNYLYDNASIAGRKVFLGWPYFPWSSGFDTTTRSNEIKSILSQHNPKTLCTFLTKKSLDYVYLTKPSDDFPFDPSFWHTNFHAIYTNPETNAAIYMKQDICGVAGQ